MNKALNIVLKLLATVLIVAAALKAWQLLTEPVANNDIFSYRPVLILTVEFELALAIWLLSGLFKKAAWLAALTCFSLFSVITFYKAITGAESCACFGSVNVNPWITLFLIDVPAVAALSVFRPKAEKLIAWPSIPRFATTFCLGLLVFGTTTPILALNEPADVTSSYELLEPETWIGKDLPILEYIDIANLLEKGNWLILLYHHDCPDCIEAIPGYEQMARDLAGNEDFLRIALIEVPPYGPSLLTPDSPCTPGWLTDKKQWFITTPAVALLADGKVKSTWQQITPDFETIVQTIAKMYEITAYLVSPSTNHSPNSLLKGGDYYANAAP